MTQSHGTQDLNGGSLLPCPFCKMDLIRTESSAQAGIREPFYEHPDSKCILRVLTFMDHPDMVDRWNRRSEPSEPVAKAWILVLKSGTEGSMFRDYEQAKAVSAGFLGSKLIPLYASPNPGAAK